MTILRVQVAFDHDTGLPEDAVQNTWHFLVPDPILPGTPGTCVQRLENFYEEPTPSLNRVSQYLASSLTGTASAKVYDLADPEPRLPIHEGVITITPAGGDPYPEEVAIVLSYRLTPIAGVNPKRSRGRIFLGPLDADVGQYDGNGMRVHPSARTTIAQAAARLAGDSDAIAEWRVYSPTEDAEVGVALEDASYLVQEGYVSDAFATMRKRGRGELARTLWVAA